MVTVQNTFADNRAATLDGKETIFRAHEIKQMPDNVFDAQGNLKFPWMKIVSFENNVPTNAPKSSNPVRTPSERTEFLRKKMRRFVYEFVNTRNGQRFVTDDIADAAKKVGAKNRFLLMVYIRNKKWFFNEWAIKSHPIQEYRATHPEFFKIEEEK